MAEKSSDILDKAKAQGLATPSAGMKAPEGYFADFAARMCASLPERPEIEHPETISTAPRTTWEKVRPYVYMAAMFAGIWLMLQVFTIAGGSHRLVPMDDNAVIANALSSDEFLIDYLHDDIDDWNLVDEMIGDEALQGDLQFDDLLLAPDPVEEQGSETTYILPQ